MIIKNVAKGSGKSYMFYNASVVDTDANVFGFILDERIVKDTEKLSDLLSAKNVPVKADIRFVPRKFDISGSILTIEIA